MLLFHHHYGTMEFIFPASLTLLLLVLWSVSMAALYKAPIQRKHKMMLGVLFIVIPPAAIIWLGKEVLIKYGMASQISERRSI